MQSILFLLQSKAFFCQGVGLAFCSWVLFKTCPFLRMMGLVVVHVISSLECPVLGKEDPVCRPPRALSGGFCRHTLPSLLTTAFLDFPLVVRTGPSNKG